MMPLAEASATAIPRPLRALEKLFWLDDQNRLVHFATAPKLTGGFHVEDTYHGAIRIKGSVRQRGHGVHCYCAPGASGV